MNIRHTGIYVRDLDGMVEFYQSMFGLQIAVRQIEEGSYIDTVFAKKDTRIDVCKLRFPDGGMIELIRHFESDNSTSKSDKLYSLGKMHIAITVYSADETYDKFIEAKCKTVSEPCVSADGKAKVFFAQDLEGNYLELVEEL